VVQGRDYPRAEEGKRAEAISELELCAKLEPDFEDGKKELAPVRASR
jgi:hypothetical protein